MDPIFATVIIILFGLIITIPFFSKLVGLVTIKENQVGIAIRKFGSSLPPGKLIALKNEAGYQADTLPPGWHFGYWILKYRVEKIPVMVVPSGQIALVVAADGATIPPERILGKAVDCDGFQDARKFLTNGGEKGRQLGILTAGTYRINTALFTVILEEDAEEYGMQPEQLSVYNVESDKVGIVTTMDGIPIDEGEIAGPPIDAHDNFQNAQTFLDKEGRRGLQEQILLSGSWNLNPWFVRVEQVPMTQIPIGHVGIVISYVGQPFEDVSGEGFKHGNLVEQGHKGVWVTPLNPGKHPINNRIMKVELVPTTNIVLNWAMRTETHSFDSNLSPITVRSKDGFSFNLDISQIIHIGAKEAPKVISRAGSVQNLVDHVLQPIVGNYFRNAAQMYTGLDFLSGRGKRQAEAAGHIYNAVQTYDVEAIDTLIGDIGLPEQLMTTQTDRKIAEEQRKTYEVQQMAQEQRQELVRETSLADIQQEMVKAERGVEIAKLQANANIEQAKGKAEGTRLEAKGEAAAIQATGDAKAKAYQAGVNALGGQGYISLQLMHIIGDNEVRIVPDVSVSGSNQNGLLDSLMGVMLHNQIIDGGLISPSHSTSAPIDSSSTTEPSGNKDDDSTKKPDTLEVSKPITDSSSGGRS
ncbi:MAG: flotillin family protein [Deltaproteobacteria bacterium]|nr:flotillin family protein [Deltaproteobacteria bacterium]